MLACRVLLGLLEAGKLLFRLVKVIMSDSISHRLLSRLCIPLIQLVCKV